MMVNKNSDLSKKAFLNNTCLVIIFSVHEKEMCLESVINLQELVTEIVEYNEDHRSSVIIGSLSERKLRNPSGFSNGL